MKLYNIFNQPGLTKLYILPYEFHGGEGFWTKFQEKAGVFTLAEAEKLIEDIRVGNQKNWLVTEGLWDSYCAHIARHLASTLKIVQITEEIDNVHS